MIRTCPLFANSERKFIAAITTILMPEVYLPAQFIVIAGYVSRCMYFIRRCAAALWTPSQCPPSAVEAFATTLYADAPMSTLPPFL